MIYFLYGFLAWLLVFQVQAIPVPQPGLNALSVSFTNVSSLVPNVEPTDRKLEGRSVSSVVAAGKAAKAARKKITASTANVQPPSNNQNNPPPQSADAASRGTLVPVLAAGDAAKAARQKTPTSTADVRPPSNNQNNLPPTAASESNPNPPKKSVTFNTVVEGKRIEIVSKAPLSTAKPVKGILKPSKPVVPAPSNEQSVSSTQPLPIPIKKPAAGTASAGNVASPAGNVALPAGNVASPAGIVGGNAQKEPAANAAAGNAAAPAGNPA